MERIVRILIACGSGVATSTVAQEAVKKIVEEANIPAKLYKGSLGEIPIKQDEVDIILTTANYRKPLNKPCMTVFGLISGVNEEQVKRKVIELCNEVLKNKK